MADDDTPRDLLGTVTDATRAATLRELVRAYRMDPTDPWLSYAELRRAVGVDDAGNFNYHLRQLGTLIEKGEPGYRVSRHGMTVAAALASGLLEPDWNWGPVDAPGACPFCGDPVVLRYDGEAVELACGDNAHALALPGTPALLEGAPDVATVCERLAVLVHGETATLRHGICPACSGAVTRRLRYDAVDPPHWHHHSDCQRCGLQYGYSVGVAALSLPRVERFLRTRGVFPRTTPFWTMDWPTPDSPTVVAEDPLRVRLVVRAGGDTLTVTLDRTGTVVDTTLGEA